MEQLCSLKHKALSVYIDPLKTILLRIEKLAIAYSDDKDHCAASFQQTKIDTLIFSQKIGHLWSHAGNKQVTSALNVLNKERQNGCYQELQA